jgi:hypothetical protein
MAAKNWYHLFPHRLVLETMRVKTCGLPFVLKRLDDILYWEGRTHTVPEGVDAPPLHFLVVYPEAFPAIPPNVEVVSPDLDPAEWGHEWHRWWDGNVCYVRPSRWQVSTTADEIIKKVEDWYFNYTAKKEGLIGKMPDVGKAELPVCKIEQRNGG